MNEDVVAALIVGIPIVFFAVMAVSMVCGLIGRVVFERGAVDAPEPGQAIDSHYKRVAGGVIGWTKIRFATHEGEVITFKCKSSLSVPNTTRVRYDPAHPHRARIDYPPPYAGMLTVTAFTLAGLAFFTAAAFTVF